MGGKLLGLQLPLPATRPCVIAHARVLAIADRGRRQPCLGSTGGATGRKGHDELRPVAAVADFARKHAAGAVSVAAGAPHRSISDRPQVRLGVVGRPDVDLAEAEHTQTKRSQEQTRSVSFLL
jgi:hypothetical protein